MKAPIIYYRAAAEESLRRRDYSKRLDTARHAPKATADATWRKFARASLRVIYFRYENLSRYYISFFPFFFAKLYLFVRNRIDN